jgi:Arc/MetJ family transcription regulator
VISLAAPNPESFRGSINVINSPKPRQTRRRTLFSRGRPLRCLPRVLATVELSPPPGYGGNVKATPEYDETRLKRVMKLTGLKSRKAALDYALREAEHAAKMRRFLKSLLPDAEYAGAVAPDYDVLAVREKTTPYRA